jgi:hypothetical protein
MLLSSVTHGEIIQLPPDATAQQLASLKLRPSYGYFVSDYTFPKDATAEYDWDRVQHALASADAFLVITTSSPVSPRIARVLQPANWALPDLPQLLTTLLNEAEPNVASTTQITELVDSWIPRGWTIEGVM